jgi:glutamine amidotransferase
MPASSNTTAVSTDAVAIIDGGGANIASLKFALQRLGREGRLTVDPDQIAQASHIILPGVGAAEDAMRRLREHGLDRLIPGLQQPVLGICLGMQLLFDASEEDDAECLGIMPGVARRFEPGPERPVPHMGWNRILQLSDCDVLAGIPEGAHFYFVHSYALDISAHTIATANYDRDFSAVVTLGNFYATQFHPERSGPHGARLLANFLKL